MLKVENLTVAYGDIVALEDVSFSVDDGEVVSIIGANGAGKTSLLNTLMGLVPSRSGRVVYIDPSETGNGRGHDILPLSAHERAGMGIRIVPERARVFPNLTVEQNLRMGVYGLSGRINVEEAFGEVFDLFPVLKERRWQAGQTLSGGEQQQLAIARALVSGPKMLLVDEISMGLMPKLVDLVFSVLKRLNEDKGLTILLVEQNAVQALAIAHRGYILETGRIALEGKASDLMEDTKVREAYLGG
ncbi:MAG: ABC transporter ATP-binding protein [Thermovirgaceae bacterium]|jgi:branched-chain amino acid transport system ATP-binding protein|nr:ABC transporter ATP-binding protein [Synergistales bacterium]MDI9392231.1 ABC transporter ATP-binding protein [Synergistota bacterium]NLV65380.1 ABC transporter ATP-binding protein [Synergistaceae bacterium]HRW87780.1 ABC transporter ATP-binding protein [Thermovirgaceae bacterium]MDD3134365.1 ABC transporter ATP-binding protein [Synergistales bacterium]